MRLEKDWRPVGIDDLEESAWEALLSRQNVRVLAGPGAGKTEFLTQRAIFLLQTGLCPRPYKILAISFKRDAARNLSDRVALRIGKHGASQLHSKTFDSFCKGLIDQFLCCIPAYWRPTKAYKLVFPDRRYYQRFLNAARQGCNDESWRIYISQLDARDFERKFVGRMKLPGGDFVPTNAAQWVTKYWWDYCLRGDEESCLSFPMITRLTERLLGSNPQIARALRATYPFVFLDEFQDTTYAQYEMLQSAFQGSSSVTTAVGDEKQRIMAWAGAKPEVFSAFAADFGATAVQLFCNYRSNPSLVSIQHTISQALEADSLPAKSMAAQTIDEEAAQVWHCHSNQHESAWVASWIHKDRSAHGLQPRDYGVLVRQKADDFEPQLAKMLEAYGLRLRNESRKIGLTTLQDMLAEEVTQIVLALVRLASGGKHIDAWTRAVQAIVELRNINPAADASSRRVQKELNDFIFDLNQEVKDCSVNSETARRVINKVVGFLDLASLAECYPQYASGEHLRNTIDAVVIFAEELAEHHSAWHSLWDEFEGIDQIPLMTVHKSKGLEFHTVIFLGLDDTQWWSHSPGNHESLATFFVAFSRAKQRVFFTYCANRSRQKIADLFALMISANISEVQVPEVDL